MEVKQALDELRKLEKKKFNQSIDLIINLKGIDMKRDNVSAVVKMPHKIKEKKICAFLNAPSNLVKTITKLDFSKYREKKDFRKLIKEYDVFIASASLMPAVATAFGKVLGPSGKMPSPQLGVIAQETDAVIKEALDRVSKSVRVKLKEASIKIVVGKESMKDEEIMENIKVAYAGIIDALPTKRENVKNAMIKLTMSKPIKVEVK
jgi:large subunit ribosomal protein L1